MTILVSYAVILILLLSGCSDEGNPPQEHECYWDLSKACVSKEKQEIEGESTYLLTYLSYPIIHTGKSKNESCRTPDVSEFVTDKLDLFSCLKPDGRAGKSVSIEADKNEYMCPFAGASATANTLNFEMKVFVGEVEVPLECTDFRPSRVSF